MQSTEHAEQNQLFISDALNGHFTNNEDQRLTLQLMSA